MFPYYMNTTWNNLDKPPFVFVPRMVQVQGRVDQIYGVMSTSF